MDRIENATIPKLARRNLPVVSVVPDLPDADKPTFFDLSVLGAIAVASPKTTGARFETFDLVSMDLEMVEDMVNKTPAHQKRRCLLIHASRNEHVLAMVALLDHLNGSEHYAIVLTGSPQPSQRLDQLIHMLRHSSISIYRIERPTLEIVDSIRAYTSKMTPQDAHHVERVQRHYATYLDGILESLCLPP